ncbi:TlpA disulfide reductase family protein [Xanthobacter sp. VTT E-85241]|uniref:thiol:disulfide interchange protein TlpA n=1 Tax=Roseixanthobacter finlandensis TaxID=3119922 RepID=UPI00372C3EC1
MTEPTLPPAPPEHRAEPARGGKGRMLAVVAGAALAGAVAGALALYGMNALPGNAPTLTAASSPTNSQVAAAPESGSSARDPACAPAVEAAKRLAPLAKGEIAAFTLATEPRRLPPLSFADGTGTPKTLADFKGKTLLVNLWATWCVPCRKEMPALDRLEQTLGGANFQVVAINLDTRDAEKPKAFLKEIGISSLAFYADSGTKTFQALRAVGRGFGLPTTLLVDDQGCELGYLAGPAEWASEDAQHLIKSALGGGQG